MKQRIWLFMLSVAFAFAGFKYVEKVYPNISVECKAALLNDDSRYRFYVITDSNKMMCDLSTVSLIVQNMKSDGYSVYQETDTENEVDVILQKDGLYIRMYYETAGMFTSIASAYEKSYIPFTYINEGSGN